MTEKLTADQGVKRVRRSPLYIENVDGSWCVLDPRQPTGEAPTVIATLPTRKAAQELRDHLAYHDREEIGA